ncbi:MAG: hypothetical protein CMM58_02180 [Rhodospirillaceae bacterium]|nr:hypothetical protein [Rhodospirillaceae bacterium]|tara:strand:+ start:5605 stop:6240 length:636 start_codon:yes stop_codon:yes gene_type:complete
MILYTDATTPFGRKCLVAALERDINLEEQFVTLSDPGSFLDINPLNQIPALVTSDQRHYFDSDVILQYLDELHEGPPLIPKANRYHSMTSIHLANAVIESTLLRIMEKRRIGAEQSESFIIHLEHRIARGISRMEESRSGVTEGPLTGEEITTAVALSYVNFRYPHDWASSSPRLSDWYATIVDRHSMRVSQPTRESPTHSPATKKGTKRK